MAAVAALRRAADLAENASRRTSLFLYAAELASEVGQRSTAADLAAKADPELMGPVERGRLIAVHEIVVPGDLRDESRIQALIDHAEAARKAGDATLATNLLWRAASRCWWACVSPQIRRAVAEAVAPLPLAPGDPRRLGILAFAQPEVYGRQALTFMQQQCPTRIEEEALRFLCSAAVILGDYHRVSSYVRTVAADCRASGQLALLARILGAKNGCRVWTGEWDLVRAEAQEAAELAEEIGDSFRGLSAKVDLAMLAGQRGDHESAETLALKRSAAPSSRACLHAVRPSTCARVAALVAGRHEEAFARLKQVFLPTSPAYHDQRWWAAPDFADAARHLGRQDEARPVLRELEQVAEQLPSPMMRMCRSYVSHRTVGAHLYRIFPKLGITSRAQLRSVLRIAGADAGSEVLQGEGSENHLIIERTGLPPAPVTPHPTHL